MCIVIKIENKAYNVMYMILYVELRGRRNKNAHNAYYLFLFSRRRIYLCALYIITNIFHKPRYVLQSDEC